FGAVDAPEVAVRIMAWFVSPGGDGALEPRNRLLQLAELDEIGTDIVVRVAELRIDGNRLLALGDGVVVAVQEAVGPSQEGMRLGGRMIGERALVEAHGFVEVAAHLFLIGLLE